jgi:hypothetical protein
MANGQTSLFTHLARRTLPRRFSRFAMSAQADNR